MNATQYSRLALQYRDFLLRIALNFFHDAEVAEDIVQDCLLRLWVARERLTDETDFRAFGIRIAKNLCVNEWKRRQTHAHTDLPPPDLPSASDTAAPTEEAEDRQRLAQALNTLSPTERRIFTLWSNEQLDTAQIAAILNIKPTTASNTLSKVKRKLFQLLCTSP